MPPALIIFCNLVDVMRMREELILQLADSSALDAIFTKQKKLVNMTELGTLSS